MNNYKYIPTAIFIAFWAVCDDAVLTRWPASVNVILATGAALAGIALLTRKRPALRWPALALLGAMAASWAANPELNPAIVQFIFAGTALAGMFTAAWIGADTLRRALVLAAPLWLIGLIGVGTGLGIIPNKNIIGFWCMFFIIVLLADLSAKDRLTLADKINLALVVVLAGLLLLVESRGAMVAVIAAVLVIKPPKLTPLRVGLFAAGALVLLTALALLEPVNLINRAYYWSATVQAAAGHNPLFGLGPGGILARGILPEPGTLALQPHAHNFIVHVFGELGLIGLAALLWGLIWSYRRRAWFQPWQLALTVGVLTHSLIDHPLFYLSPLLVFMMVLGSVCQPSS